MRNRFYFEILDKKRQEILKSLSKILGSGYYLAGGTALALQIGHRKSFDFDLFRNAEIKFSLKQKVLKEFRDHPIQTLVDTSDELSLIVKNKVKLTFLNYFWDPIFPLVKVTGLIPLLSIKDIATTKAYALGRRGNYRDYFDIYVIIKNGYATLKNIIKDSKRKYGEIFSERMFLEQLLYFGDIEKDKKLKFLNEKYIPPQNLAEFFKKQIRDL